MRVPDTTRADVLVERARRAGGTGPAGFADWLIIDEEWFGPCAGMDTATYEHWRRRAEEIYAGPGDACVSINSRTTPWAVDDPAAAPAATEPPRSRATIPRWVLVTVALLFVVAFAATSRALVGDRIGEQQPPAVSESDHTCPANAPPSCEAAPDSTRLGTP